MPINSTRTNLLLSRLTAGTCPGSIVPWHFDTYLGGCHIPTQGDSQTVPLTYDICLGVLNNRHEGWDHGPEDSQAHLSPSDPQKSNPVKTYHTIYLSTCVNSECSNCQKQDVWAAAMSCDNDGNFDQGAWICLVSAENLSWLDSTDRIQGSAMSRVAG